MAAPATIMAAMNASRWAAKYSPRHAIKLTGMRGIRAQRMIPSVFPRRADDSRESTSPASQAGHVLERYRAYRRASGLRLTLRAT